ncbi:MAG: hypothetical protein AABX51_04220 [Nanoarchaeota archaeon]
MKKIILLILALIAIPTVLAASFSFNPDPSAWVFNITEKTTFLWDMNVSVTETLVQYSREATNLSNLDLHNETGMINYTPPASDVGYHASGVFFISKNRTNPIVDYVAAIIIFNVSNVNDPPNITFYQPNSTQVFMNETATTLFNITATDEDIVFGDSINVSWYIDGGLLQTELSNATVNITYNFTAGFCNASTFNVTTKVTDLGGLFVQQYWNFTINNSNRPPVLNGTFENIVWNEDTNLLNNLTLIEYYYDPDAQECTGINRDNLTFRTNLTYGSNSGVNISIDINSSNASFYPDPDYVGNITLIFIANDSNSNASSNPFTISVINVPDAPVMMNLSNQTGTVNVSFSYLINASDPDLIYGDNLTWWSNSSFFNMTKINSTHAMINFTAIISQVGNYSIIVSVNDTYNLTDSHIFFLIIQDNMAPVLNFIGNQNATQDILFKINVSGYDEDNDTIIFSSNSTFFNVTAHNETMGNISFSPTNDQVGNYSILFTAIDAKGSTANEIIMFRIDNVNDAPSIFSIISPQYIKVNNTLTVNVTAADSDLRWGDLLIFGDNSSLFNISTINSTWGQINYTPNVTEVGNYSISVHVNDSNGLTAAATFQLVVTNSTAPILDPIGNYSVPENTFFRIAINATDSDGDPLVFTINSTFLNVTNFTFNFDSSFGNANFSGIPDQYDLGNHSFEINVSDGSGNLVSGIFWINITFVDDTPILQSISNQTTNENSNFLLNVTAYDEEIILFGSVLNLTFYQNTTLFNFTAGNNATSKIINFTPAASEIGNFSINITVSDGNSNTSRVFWLEVRNVNDPPRIILSTPSTSTPSVLENSTIIFSINATDPDVFFNETLSIAWYLDGNNQTSGISTYFNGTNLTSTLTYAPYFCDAGIHNITAIVYDNNLSQNRSYWSLTVTNVDRVPEFGIKRQTRQIDFSNGTFFNTSATNSSGNVTLFKINSTHYADFGTFTSPLFDFGSKYAFSSDINITHLNNMEWDVTLPSNTSFLLQYRTSLDGSSFTNWSNNFSVTNFSFAAPSVRYVQYKGYFYSNSLLTLSPILEEVRINYTMNDITISQNTRYTNIIDLADYFSDPDATECTGANRDNLSLSVTGNDSIMMRFSGSVITLLEHTTFEGQDAVQFTGNDSYNTTLSEEILFTVVPNPGGSISSTTTSSSGGGGSGGASSSTVQTIIKNKNVTKPIALNIIVPKPLVIYQNESMSVPIELVNSENFTLKDIHLYAEVPNGTMESLFTIDYFEKLEKDTRVNTTLVIRSFKSLGTYEIIVKANVSDPEYLATASFFVSSIELGSANESQFNTRITFARDLLTENPECLELTEQLTKAQGFLKEKDYNSAEQILTQVIEDCRLMISLKDDTIERPGQQLTFERILRFVRKPVVMAITVLTLLGVIGFTFYRVMSKGPLPKRKLSPEEEEIAAILGIKRK